MKKILIELPTWLGDCVMATSAIENIIHTYPKVKMTIFGTKISSAVFSQHPNLEKIIIDNSKSHGNRLFNLYKIAKKVGQFDCAFSFRRRFSSHFFIFFVNTKHRAIYQRYDKKSQHQVLRYNDFVNRVLGINNDAGALKIYTKKTQKNTKKTLGINPGASYGSAKRWYPLEFAKVASAFCGEYDIIIFGSSDEIDIAADIEKFLLEEGVSNYQNLAGKTMVFELIEKISNLDLLITGDSGPMHIGASFQVPTVAIFGPTKDNETRQWMNKKSVIVKKNLDCQPCMQRICPLKHHNCMRQIKASTVLEAIESKISLLN